MRQAPREISHQELYKIIRDVRADLYVVEKKVSSLLEHHKEVSDFIEDYKLDHTGRLIQKHVLLAQENILNARNMLRQLLEVIDTSGCYPDPPTDLPQDFSTPSGLSRQEINGLLESVTEIHGRVRDLVSATLHRELEGWATRYHEEAVFNLASAKQSLKVYLGLTDEEPHSGKGERVQDNSDKVHDGGGGFQASAREGRIRE